MKTSSVIGPGTSSELEGMIMAKNTTSKVDTKHGFGKMATTMTDFLNGTPLSEIL